VDLRADREGNLAVGNDYFLAALSGGVMSGRRGSVMFEGWAEPADLSGRFALIRPGRYKGVANVFAKIGWTDDSGGSGLLYLGLVDPASTRDNTGTRNFLIATMERPARR